jgi:Rieske Fe-S protein
VATRRVFLTTLGAVSAAVAAGCGTDRVAGPPGTPVTGTFRAPLPAVGNTTNIAGAGAGGQGIAVTRTGTDTVVAVSRRCTHQGCTIALPATPGATLNCPCHGSRFTINGTVVQGPAQNPLQSYPAVIDNATDEVVVTVA